MRIIELPEILQKLDEDTAYTSIRNAFMASARGATQIAAVGHLGFEEVRGECHIKSAAIHGEPAFAVKVATGFYDNHRLNLPSGNGLILVLSSQTGEPLALLRDNGVLTDIRTAMAGAIVAAYCAPPVVRTIGVLGTGMQARLQLKYLRKVIQARNVVVWGRSVAKAEGLALDAAEFGYNAKIAASPSDVLSHSDLVVSVTASTTPLILGKDLHSGMHITAVGADGGGKCEISPCAYARATVRIVDNISQCLKFGDSARAVEAGVARPEDFQELGSLLGTQGQLQRHADSISIADLTGVGFQDTAIALAVCRSCGIV
jgi:ornithine cyclodeaminase